MCDRIVAGGARRPPAEGAVPYRGCLLLAGPAGVRGNMRARTVAGSGLPARRAAEPHTVAHPAVRPYLTSLEPAVVF